MDIRVLMQKMHDAESDAEKDFIQEEISKEFSSLSEEDKKAVRKVFLEALDEKIEEARRVINKTDVMIAISEISKYVSLSTIARDYFGKSKEWLYQRIKGYLVNGKPAEFTARDREILAKALKDIADRLTETSLKIA
ncbi:MAG: DUF5053 domain-containing protein [Mangrovibacterium sp.]